MGNNGHLRGRGRGERTSTPQTSATRNNTPQLPEHEHWEDEATAVAAIIDSPAGEQALPRLRRQLIIDMDDTLISNQILFTHAGQALVAVYGAQDPQGRTAEELKHIHEQIDHDLIPTMGYTPERWHFSAQRAAELIWDRSPNEHERAAIRQAADIAMGVGEVLPGVYRTLRALQRHQVPMVLKTKGSPTKQTEKLLAHGFANEFGERIHIVDIKDRSTFQDIAARYAFDQAVSIGDSEKSDIVPALEAGLGAILINKGGGERMSYELVDSPLQVPTVRSFPSAIWHLLYK